MNETTREQKIQTLCYLCQDLADDTDALRTTVEIAVDENQDVTEADIRAIWAELAEDHEAENED